MHSLHLKVPLQYVLLSALLLFFKFKYAKASKIIRTYRKNSFIKNSIANLICETYKANLLSQKNCSKKDYWTQIFQSIW